MKNYYFVEVYTTLDQMEELHPKLVYANSSREVKAIVNTVLESDTELRFKLVDKITKEEALLLILDGVELLEIPYSELSALQDTNGWYHFQNRTLIKAIILLVVILGGFIIALTNAYNDYDQIHEQLHEQEQTTRLWYNQYKKLVGE